jgi:membrane-bound lytic murein transglycosylase B
LAEGFRPRALEAGIPAATFDAAMRGVEFNPKVVERDRNQNEFQDDLGLSGYRRVRGPGGSGLKAIAANRDLLDRIEAEYGVEKEVVVAVWGLESAYGTYRGDLPVLGSWPRLPMRGGGGRSSRRN